MSACVFTKGHINSFSKFPNLEQFCEVMELDPNSYEAKMLFYKLEHIHFMHIGKFAGWWELTWDHFGMDRELSPIQVVVKKISEIEHKKFAPLLAELKLFESTKDAKRNGWDKDIVLGDFFFKKKTFILRIV